ncbi:MAG: helix-turn-helix transcriptional regulator [Chloroflexi bacterium]|nr:helix-turn-helix transcriptional regulator [Chloroflexota bacterium]MYC01563.1 helix-turn-helix transcriptional regulator [Chloroflexota bacterium]
MLHKRGRFDNRAFYQALDATRQARRVTWKQVSAESGVSASTLTRMAQGRRPDVDGLAALASWAALSADDFVRSATKPESPEPLAMISTFLRADSNLTPEAAETLDQVVKVAYERLRTVDKD